MKKRLSVLLAAALFAALLLTGCPNKDKAPDASGEESSAAAVMTTAAAAGETDAESGSTESTDSGEPTPSDTASADASSSVGGAEVSAENTSRQTAQTKAGNAAQTTAKPKPGQTTAATKATQTTAKPLAALPLKTQWILKPSLNYDMVRPTTDEKNWIGGMSSNGEYEWTSLEAASLIDSKGKVIVRADLMTPAVGKTFGDRIVARKGEKYALLSTDGKVILDYQDNWMFIWGDDCLLMQKGKDNWEFVQIDHSGKKIGDYKGIVGLGGGPEEICLFDRKKKLLYSAELDRDTILGDTIYSSSISVIKKDIPSKCIALVGENLKEKYSGEDDELPISSFLGYGVVINGELKSTAFYKELSLLNGFSDWRRDLYIAGTGTERFFTNTAGKAVLTEKFADISANESCTVAAVKQNGKWGFIRVPEL